MKPTTEAEGSSETPTTTATMVADITESEVETIELVEEMEPRMELMEDPACQPHPSTLISRFSFDPILKVHLYLIWFKWLLAAYIHTCLNFFLLYEFFNLTFSSRLRALVWRTPCSTVWWKKWMKHRSFVCRNIHFNSVTPVFLCISRPDSLMSEHQPIIHNIVISQDLFCWNIQVTSLNSCFSITKLFW